MCVGGRCIERIDDDVEAVAGEPFRVGLVGAATGEHEGPRGRREQLVDDRAADLTRAAEEDDRLGFVQGVLHGASIRLGRGSGGEFESATQVARPHAGRVDPVANGPPLVEPWVAAADAGRRHVEVLGEVVPATGGEHEFVE